MYALVYFQLRGMQRKAQVLPSAGGSSGSLGGEGLVLTDPVTEEDSESEVEAVGGLNVCLAPAMSYFQRKE